MAKRSDIILASGSPRRIEMFRREGFDVKVQPADIEEHLPMDMSPQAAVMYLALRKAMDVAKEHRGLIVAADTVVVYDGQIIGKPRNEAEAFQILSALRGKTHQVITGVCLMDTAEVDPDAAGKEGVGSQASTAGKLCLHDVTDVTFTTYSNEELVAYVSTPEPYDKAGGYAIQGTFGQYIDHIEGDLDNVVGFPMYRVKPYLERTL